MTQVFYSSGRKTAVGVRVCRGLAAVKLVGLGPDGSKVAVTLANQVSPQSVGKGEIVYKKRETRLSLFDLEH